MLTVLVVSLSVGAAPEFEVVENRTVTPLGEYFQVVENKCDRSGAAVRGTRAPVGHTHTCRNGHTWDHTVTPSHNCPECGAYQNVQDPFPRTVTAGVHTPARTAGTQSHIGCVNGNCSTSTALPQRAGWQPGKLLGRR